MLITPDGWLVAAEKKISPYFDSRPKGEISLLVIHCISLPPGEFNTGAIEKLFMGTLDCQSDPYYQTHLLGKQVSSHVLIRRSGEVVQFVSFLDRAWHAGVSSFKGREKCNDFSIGIELEGTDDQPFEPVQYDSLIKLTQEILKNYPAITPENILGHEDIAPGRKTDPGKFFNWNFYKESL